MLGFQTIKYEGSERETSVIFRAVLFFKFYPEQNSWFTVPACYSRSSSSNLKRGK